jgi:ABC-type dipeptide/oligopeptide/nickel transport system permease component
MLDWCRRETGDTCCVWGDLFSFKESLNNLTSILSYARIHEDNFNWQKRRLFLNHHLEGKGKDDIMSMWKYVLERIILIFLTAIIILCLTYILLQLLPVIRPGGTFLQQVSYWRDQVKLGFWEEVTDKVRIMKGDYTVPVTDGLGTSPFDFSHNAYFKQLPLMVRFWNWFVNVFTKWNWGTSIAVSQNESAIEIEMGYLPVSMKINIWAVLISIPLGMGLGIAAALRKNTYVDNSISTLIMVFISVPSFVSISFLLIWLAYGTHLLPFSWPSIADSQADPSLAIKAYIIPVAALSFGSIASFARYTRAELTEIMSSEFLLLARTKGLTKPQTVLRHAYEIRWCRSFR